MELLRVSSTFLQLPGQREGRGFPETIHYISILKCSIKITYRDEVLNHESLESFLFLTRLKTFVRLKQFHKKIFLQSSLILQLVGKKVFFMLQTRG